MRGLTPPYLAHFPNGLPGVAPHVGARIETAPMKKRLIRVRN